MCCECKEKNICKIAIVFTILFTIIMLIFVLMISNNTQQKDVLTAIAVKGDNTEIGVASIKFSMNEIQEGNAITHEPGSDSILINESGLYQVSYQLYGIRDTIGTFNFNAVLVVNDISLDNTFNESPILRDNVANRMTLTSTVILKLNAGDVLKLTGVSIEDIVYTRARIDIEKL